MLKRPIEVNLNTQDTTINHRVTIAPATLTHIRDVVTSAGATVVVTTASVFLVKVVADIAVHIAKTKIK